MPSFGGVLLKNVGPEHVDKMLEKMARNGASKNTMVRVRAVANMVMTDALKRRLVTWNPVSVTETPDGPKRERRSLTHEEVDALRDIIRGDRLEACWLTMVWAGLRPGEVTGLLWSDVDLKAGLLRVRRARLHTPDGMVLGAPKTDRSTRTLEIPAPLKEALEAHKACQRQEKMAHRDVWADNNLVFCTQLGTPIDRGNLRRAFAELTEEAGLGALHPTVLRHTYVSLASDAGVPLEEIADAVGHAPGSRMTAGTYRHNVRSTVGASARAAIERTYGGDGA